MLVLRLQNAIFKKFKVQALLKQTLKERMESQQYDPVKGAQVVGLLPDADNVSSKIPIKDCLSICDGHAASQTISR